ncbi:MAG: TetR/AcrR family transcriptional regulator [Sulfuriferula sp.]
MPRCREFDIDQALDQALNAFWLKGYEATSMTDLMAAMGLSKSSFYECFGSKREALLAALRRYSAREMAETQLHFSTCAPVATLLAAWVRHSIDPAACRPSQRCGCLIVNIAVELAPHDREIEAAVRHHLDMFAVFLTETIRRGNAEGSVPSRLDPAYSADLLLNLIAGIQVLAKGGVETHRLAAIIDVQLECLLGSSQ